MKTGQDHPCARESHDVLTVSPEELHDDEHGRTLTLTARAPLSTEGLSVSGDRPVGSYLFLPPRGSRFSRYGEVYKGTDTEVTPFELTTFPHSSVPVWAVAPL